MPDTSTKTRCSQSVHPSVSCSSTTSLIRRFRRPSKPSEVQLTLKLGKSKNLHFYRQNNIHNYVLFCDKRYQYQITNSNYLLFYKKINKIFKNSLRSFNCTLLPCHLIFYIFSLNSTPKNTIFQLINFKIDISKHQNRFSHSFSTFQASTSFHLQFL